MTLYRCILPDHALEESPGLRKVREGCFTAAQVEELNAQGYNIYFLPNYPSQVPSGRSVDGQDIDTFEYVFVDMDLKEGKYKDKQAFLAEVLSKEQLMPSRIVDSGNGVHVYWRVTDLDAMSYLRFQRRLIRFFDTDEAIGQIYQLMRVAGTVNTKHKDAYKLCEVLYEDEITYDSNQLDAALPIIQLEDEEYCKQHFDKTYKLTKALEVDDKLPIKFGELLKNNQEVKDIWAGKTDDRSKADYRLGHIMFASTFTKDEAMSVLVNSAKALTRAPVHRVGYAQSIVEKIWTYELSDDKDKLDLSSTVREILERAGDQIKGTRFPCWPYLDATEHGFRLGQVIGLVGGSGVGKTAMALNMFEGFVQNNPDYDHFFVPLEQPATEIADRWKTMCGDNVERYNKVHIISNYDENGGYRHLSLPEIRDYIIKFQTVTGRKVGAVVIDHIGALKRKLGTDIEDICHEMKAFAVQTNTMLVMQSQTSREKAGIGDLELNKDAAYGTVFFESYCDYLITIWQPLKRCHNQDGCPTVTAFKFCKIRHKKARRDKIKEDTAYHLYFDSESEHLRELTQLETKSFAFFNSQAVNKRKKDRNTDLIEYAKITWTKEGDADGSAVSDNQDSGAA